ncbi:ABC transporter permease [Pseudonocardia sp. HH130630-07]|uniref:ABC transporter permease n=1 Tax=Pseudonocardia sp. HH130630-07 TaxID=1690815 RepID=UPI000814BDB1|nr:ABC transporter permease [Pseudonocardia sp. HH130630-07]ANY07184.1 hypothetical protein AFB00_13835 [Pseudonocardia sp. HH130630-07]
MTAYVLRRLLATVPVLLGTTIVIFVAVRALPGDPVAALAGPNQTLSPAVTAALRERLGLDDPLPVQYLHWLGGLFTGDLGVDLRGREISEAVAAAWPVTVQLGLTTWLITAVVGVGLGVLTGVRAGRGVDWAVLTGTVLLVGVPYFVLAYVLQLVVGVQLGWLPVSGVRAGWPASYLLPALCLAAVHVPELVRVTRSGVLENRDAEFVDTAVAAGLHPRRVLLDHVLRPALAPVLSVLGVGLGYLLSGAVLVETVFNLPGLGGLVATGIEESDGALVVAVGTLLVLVFLLTTLAVDVATALIDPRTRHGRTS